MKKFILGFVVALVLCGIIIGIFMVANKEKSTINNNEIVNEIHIENEKDKIHDKNYYKQYAIAEMENSNTKYIIGKEKNDNWNEIIEKDGYINIFGEYDNKLYYSDENGINFINLQITPYKETKWIEFKDIQIWDDGTMAKLAISKGVIIEDTIYFEFNMQGGGTNSTDGIQKIKVTDDEIDDAIQFISSADMGKWEIDTDNDILYYIQFEYSSDGTLFKYNLKTNEKNKLFENVLCFDFNSNKILYNKFNQSTVPNDKGYFPAKYDLYLYDLNNNDNKLIFSSDNNSRSGSLSAFAEYENNDVYYKSGESIIKYNNGKNDIIYTYSKNDGGESIHGASGFYGFNVIDNNIIEIVLQKDDNKYLFNGNIVTNLIGISTFNVNMKDGTIKVFTINNIKFI